MGKDEIEAANAVKRGKQLASDLKENVQSNLRAEDAASAADALVHRRMEVFDMQLPNLGLLKSAFL